MFEISIVLALEIEIFLSFRNNSKNVDIISEKIFPIFYFSNNNISEKALQNSEIKKRSLALLDPKIKPTYRTPLSRRILILIIFLICQFSPQMQA
jgi:hypothetical protein